MSWIQTHSGRRFELLDPTPEDLHIVDIAHALGNICRFGGHTCDFYSVAQHSVLVSHAVPEPFALAGLLHDAAEAYIGDIVRPLKRIMPHFELIEAELHDCVCRRFGIEQTQEMVAAVNEADDRLLATECRDLLGKDVGGWAAGLPTPLADRIYPWGARTGRIQFLRRFEVLMDSAAIGLLPST